MYYIFLFLHSSIRWFVLASLLYALYIAGRGLLQKEPFSAHANTVRQWTVTIAHLQLLIGMVVYIQGPFSFLHPFDGSYTILSDQLFFRYIHVFMMILAVVLITIGSAKTKRIADSSQKYQTMLCWFAVALVVLLLAIPWPFSPLAQRPYLRTF